MNNKMSDLFYIITQYNCIFSIYLALLVGSTYPISCSLIRPQLNLNSITLNGKKKPINTQESVSFDEICEGN